MLGIILWSAKALATFFIHHMLIGMKIITTGEHVCQRSTKKKREFNPSLLIPDLW